MRLQAMVVPMSPRGGSRFQEGSVLKTAAPATPVQFGDGFLPDFRTMLGMIAWAARPQLIIGTILLVLGSIGVIAYKGCGVERRSNNPCAVTDDDKVRGVSVTYKSDGSCTKTYPAAK